MGTSVIKLMGSTYPNLLERSDVIIVASVSCIYGIGSVETYSRMTIELNVGMKISRQKLLRKFTELQYKRNDISFNKNFTSSALLGI